LAHRARLTQIFHTWSQSRSSRARAKRCGAFLGLHTQSKKWSTRPLKHPSTQASALSPFGALRQAYVFAFILSLPCLLRSLLSQATRLVLLSAVILPRKLNTLICGLACTLQREDMRQPSVDWWIPGNFAWEEGPSSRTLAPLACGQVPRGYNRRSRRMAGQSQFGQRLV
jgi:hypothetical protein